MAEGVNMRYAYIDSGVTSLEAGGLPALFY